MRTIRVPHGYSELPQTGPTLLARDFVARVGGWADDAEKQRCYLDCLALGARIVTDREAIGDPVQSRDEIREGIVDRIAAGSFVLPGSPGAYEVITMLYRTTRQVWDNLQADRERQWQAMMGVDQAVAS